MDEKLNFTISADTAKGRAAVKAFREEMSGLDKQANDTGPAQKRQSAWDKMGLSAKSVTKLVTGMGVAFSAAAIGAVLANWTRQSIAFQTKFAEVRTLIDETRVSASMLQTQMQGLSGAFGNMEQKAAALYQVLSAGIDGDASVQFLGEAAKFAKAGVTDLTTSVDLITTSINSYGMKADQAGYVSDILFETIKRGKTTASELGGSFGRLLGSAAAVGITFEELNATIAALTASGVPTTETMSSLKAVIANIAKPTADAVTAAKQLGIDFSITGMQAKGYQAFMEELTEKTQGNTQAQVDLFGSVEAFNAMAILTSEGGMRRFIEAMQGMETSAGNTFQALQKFQGTFAYEWERLWNNMAKSITGVEAPFGRLLKNVNDLMEAHERFNNMLNRNGGDNPQMNSLKGVSGNAAMSGFSREPLRQAFEAITGSADMLNAEIAKAFDQPGASLASVYAKFGDITQMLVPQMKQFGESATDGMKRLMDYAAAIDKTTKKLSDLEAAEKALKAHNAAIREAMSLFPDYLERMDLANDTINKLPDLYKTLQMDVAKTSGLPGLYEGADWTALLGSEADVLRARRELLKKNSPNNPFQQGYNFYNSQTGVGMITDHSNLTDELYSQRLPGESFNFEAPSYDGWASFSGGMDGILGNLTDKFGLYQTALQGVGEAWGQIITGQAAGGEAFKRLAISTISSLSKMAMVQALFEMAQGWAAAATGNPAAAAHFTSAKLFGAVAAVSGAASAALSAGGGGSSMGPSGSAFNPTYTASSGVNALNSPQQNVTIRLADALDRLEAMPAGHVVTMGVAQAGGLAAVTTDKDMRNVASRIIDSRHV